MTTKKDFIVNYIDKWLSEKNNNCKSFSYWNAMYDAVKDGWCDFDDLGISDMINDSIEWESGANRDWIEWLDDSIKAELVDISLLDELGREMDGEVKEEDINDILDDMPNPEEYENEEECEDAIQRMLDEWYYHPDITSREILEKYMDEYVTDEWDNEEEEEEDEK